MALAEINAFTIRALRFMTKQHQKRSTGARRFADESRVADQQRQPRTADKKKNFLFGAIIASAALAGGGLLIVLSTPEEATLEHAAAPQDDRDLPTPILREPNQDGWDTEFFTEQAQDQLTALLKAVFHQPVRAAEFAPVLTSDFEGQTLRPESLKTAHSADGFTVLRHSPDAAANVAADEMLSTGQWIDSLPDFARSVALGATPRTKTKIFRVEQLPGGFSTDVVFQSAAHAESKSVQVNAVWRCRWRQGDKDDPPRLAALGIQDYEEVVYDAPDPARFSDCTLAVVGSEDAFQSQLGPGLDHWLDSTPKIFDRARWGDHGLAVGDVNGDGRDDIYVCEPGALPNRLFIQNGDGTLRDASAEAGVDWLDQTRGALLVDLDNDGDQDLVVGANPALLIMANDGTGKFTLRAEVPEAVSSHSLAAADFDNDGLLDIYACAYFKEQYGPDEIPLPIPYHDATNGGRNVLLRNDGDFHFRDVTAAAGLDEANNRWSLAAAWEDFDNDGDQDLYVANDFGRNCLYVNDGGHFTNVAARAGVEDVGSGMSVAWGDYDHDGLVDLYVSNMYSNAGGRVTYQEKFKPGVPESTRAMYQRMAKGNTLFKNQGDGTFRDVSQQAAVARARWAWGAEFVDVNNDSWEDLIVANGFLTREDTRDL